jgi:hypothetical protein
MRRRCLNRGSEVKHRGGGESALYEEDLKTLTYTQTSEIALLGVVAPHPHALRTAMAVALNLFSQALGSASSSRPSLYAAPRRRPLAQGQHRAKNVQLAQSGPAAVLYQQPGAGSHAQPEQAEKRAALIFKESMVSTPVPSLIFLPLQSGSAMLQPVMSGSRIRGTDTVQACRASHHELHPLRAESTQPGPINRDGISRSTRENAPRSRGTTT